MEKRVEIDSLRSFVIGVFMISGMSEADSRVAADVLIFADQRGIRSHQMSVISNGSTSREFGSARSIPQLASSWFLKARQPRYWMETPAWGLSLLTRPWT